MPAKASIGKRSLPVSKILCVARDSNTAEIVFRIPVLIESASRIMTLERGDVIAPGTPSGVWPIAPGDVREAEIKGVGRLRCTVAARNR